MIQTKLKGMGVALITPFKEDESATPIPFNLVCIMSEI